VVLQFYWSFGRLITPVVTTTSIFISSSKIQNREIPVLANPGPPEKKMAVKTQRASERQRQRDAETVRRRDAQYGAVTYHRENLSKR